MIVNEKKSEFLQNSPFCLTLNSKIIITGKYFRNLNNVTFIKKQQDKSFDRYSDCLYRIYSYTIKSLHRTLVLTAR